MNIIKNKQSEYFICYDQYAFEATRFASSELQKYLYEATDCLIPMFSNRCERRAKEIHIGCSVRENSFLDVKKSLKEEEFTIFESDNGDIEFIGGSPRATLYSVYYFLFKTINLNMLDSKNIYFENKDDISLNLPIKINFPFEYRECYFTDAFDGKYASINFLNSNLANLSSKLGGKVKFYNCHHSFGDLLSTKDYFDTHPEYFSMIDGVRVKEHTELCLSNPQVFEICLKRLKEWIKNNPDCKVFSVAQDEWMGHFVRMACECPNCKAIDTKYGSQSASIILFVNKLAEAIEKEYPDVLIHTFAYQYSRKPPVGLKVHPNVIVRLCNIECSWNESIQEGAKRDPNGRNASFLNDLIGWSKITDRLYIWDYAVNYRNYLLPFPCIRTLKKNIEIYKELGVKGILMEGNFSLGGKGYMDELKSFLTAKLMIGETDIDYWMKFFVNNYYGKAGKYIYEYINYFEDLTKDVPLWLYDDADSLIFTNESCEKSTALIEKALDSVKDENEEIRKHVEVVKLGVDYLNLVRLPLDYPNRNELIDKFYLDLKKHKITEIMERTELNYSINVMKNSLYAKDRPNWYNLYYIMK